MVLYFEVLQPVSCKDLLFLEERTLTSQNGRPELLTSINSVLLISGSIAAVFSSCYLLDLP